MAGQPFSAAKTLLFQVPWKFNILSTFTTFAKFAKFAKFATFNPALEYLTPLQRHPPHPQSISERADAPLPALRGEGLG